MAIDEKIPPQTDLGRRNMLKGAAALVATAGLAAAEPISAQATRESLRRWNRFEDPSSADGIDRYRQIVEQAGHKDITRRPDGEGSSYQVSRLMHRNDNDLRRTLGLAQTSSDLKPRCAIECDTQQNHVRTDRLSKPQDGFSVGGRGHDLRVLLQQIDKSLPDRSV
jgi:hypothetical protein